MENQDKDSNDSIRRPARGPRVAVAQISPTLGDVAANLERHRQAAQRAIDESAQLVVFPELSLTGYRLRDSVPDVALKVGDEVLKELTALSEKVAIVVGFVEEAADHLFYNSAAYLEGGKLVSVHRKAYLPTYGMFDEQRYFARGRRIEAFDSGQGRVAMLVCEEMLHPSAPTIVACDGATMILCPSASPARGVTGEGEADGNARSWEAYNHVIARTYGLWVVYCNRVGVEDGVAFWGGSEIVSPAGDVVVKAAYYEEDYVSAVLAEDAVRRRRIVNPIVRDEDLDLTINELARIRGRKVETEQRERRGEQRGGGFGDRRRDDRPRQGGFQPRGSFDRDDDDNRGNRIEDDDRGNRRFDDKQGGGRFGKKPFGGKQFGGGGGRFGGGGNKFGDRGREGGGFGDRGREGGGFGGRGGFNRGDDRGGPPRGRFGGGGGGGQGRDDRGFGGGPPRRFDDEGRGGGGGFRGRKHGGGGGGGFGGPRDDDQPRWKGRPRVGSEDTPPRERQRPGQGEHKPRPMRVKKDRED